MPFEFYRHASSLTDQLFRRIYRMPRNVFYKLLGKLKGQDERNALPELAAELPMCLRCLAGGSYLDISVSHRAAVFIFLFASSVEVLHLIKDSNEFNSQLNSARTTEEITIVSHERLDAGFHRCLVALALLMESPFASPSRVRMKLRILRPIIIANVFSLSSTRRRVMRRIASFCPLSRLGALITASPFVSPL
jgi:hypothetical protein